MKTDWSSVGKRQPFCDEFLDQILISELSWNYEQIVFNFVVMVVFKRHVDVKFIWASFLKSWVCDVIDNGLRFSPDGLAKDLNFHLVLVSCK